MAGWLSRVDITADEFLHADQLNFLGQDVRNWGGDVNGGGHVLSNVLLQGSGSFQFYASPVQITATSAMGNNTAMTVYSTQTPPAPVVRWTSGKDGATEGGANSGSNFAITRYSDLGASLGTPFSINRQTGVISMAQQLWTGPVNANGQTLSNVVIAGMLTDPTSAKGDLIVKNNALALARLPVGTNGQVIVADDTQLTGMRWAPNTGAVASVFGRTGVIVATTGDYTAAQVTNAVSSALSYADPIWITSLNWSKIVGAPAFALASVNVFAGPGLTGGGPLTGNVTLNAAVLSVFGRAGAVVLTSADIGGAGGVLTTRRLIAGTGISVSGDGTLSADVTVTNTGVQTFNGRSGVVTLTTIDVTDAGAVPQTRTITSPLGTISGGGNLSANLSLDVNADTTIQRTRVSSNATFIAARREINFISGANITVSVNEIAASNRVDVSIAAAGGASLPIDPTTAKGDMIVRSADLPGGAMSRLPMGLLNEVLTSDPDQPLGVIWKTAPSGKPQTPWETDISGGGHNLFNVGSITATGLINSTTGGFQFPDATTQMTAGVLPTRKITAGTGISVSGTGALSADVTVGNTGVVTFNTRTGAVTLSLADVTGVGGVPGTRQVLAGAGMSGGGALTADVTLNALVTSVFGRTGAVVLTAGDITGAGGMVSPLTTKGDLLVQQSASVASRLPVGTNGHVLVADSAQTLGVKWTASAGQTPWISDINAANFQLFNVAKIGIGTSSLSATLLQVGAGTPLAPGIADFYGSTWTVATARANVQVLTTDPIAIDRGGTLGLGGVGGGNPYCFAILAGRSENNGYAGYFQVCTIGTTGNITEGLRINSAGRVGIGTTGPNKTLEVFSAGAIQVAAIIGNTTGAVGSGAYNGSGFVQGYTSTAAAAGAHLLLQPAGGNVGIGTNPLSRLSVENATQTAASLTYNAASAATFGTPGDIQLAIGVHNVNPWPMWMQSRHVTNVAWGLAINPLGGNVGIGLTGPLAPLHVYRSAGGDPTSGVNNAFAIFDSAVAVRLEIGGMASPPWTAWVQSRHQNASAVYNLALQPLGGNVGVGTVSPQGTLDVQGTSGPPNGGRVIMSDSNFDPLIRMYRWTGSGSNYGPARIRCDSNGSLFFGNSGGVVGAIGSETITERMIVRYDGNVGIGTTSPGVPLSLGTAAGAKLGVWENAGSIYGFGIGSGLLQIIVPTSGDRIALGYGTSASMTETLHVTGGKVGIGIVPSYPLHVVGDINCTGAYRVNGAAISGGVTTQVVRTVPTERNLGVIYQNTTGKPLMVTASVGVTGGTSPAVGGVDAEVGSASPPAFAFQNMVPAGGGTGASTVVSFWVLPNYYYRLIVHTYAGGGGTVPTVGIGSWVEWY